MYMYVETFYIYMYVEIIIFQSSQELSNVWAVGQKIWLRDFPGIYEAMNKEWSEPVKPIMTALLGNYSHN